MSFEAKDLGAIHKMMRRWYFNEDRMELDKVHLFEKSQNFRIGRRILAGTHEACRRLGVKKMTMTAAFSGAYVWARAGFLPLKNYEWYYLPGKLMRSANEQKNNPDVQAAFALFDYDDVRSLWQIADHKGGWDLLTKNKLKSGTQTIRWTAEFNMGDPEQEARLAEYYGEEMQWIRNFVKD